MMAQVCENEGQSAAVSCTHTHPTPTILLEEFLLLHYSSLTLSLEGTQVSLRFVATPMED